MQVWLSRSETAEWTDPAFRKQLLDNLSARCRERGRRFFQVFDANGEELLFSEVG